MILKHLLPAALAALATIESAGASDASPEKSRLTLTIAEIAPPKGALRIAVFRDPAAYERLDATLSRVVDVSAPTMDVVFDDLATGPCVILVHHDRDADGSMDPGLFGIPSEPLAASNDARGAFGPPKWRRAVFDVPVGESRHAVSFRRR